VYDPVGSLNLRYNPKSSLLLTDLFSEEEMSVIVLALTQNLNSSIEPVNNCVGVKHGVLSSK
jgi:hypothetical protein